MSAQARLALGYALFHDEQELFIKYIEEYGFGWFPLTSKSVRVLTGQGTIIDYNF